MSLLTLELEVRQKREQIPAGTLLLAVEDPEKRVGSGGATLNALLVAAEHLSARAGFTVSAHQGHLPGPCPCWNQVISEIPSSSGSTALANSALASALASVFVSVNWVDSSLPCRPSEGRRQGQLLQCF